MAPTITEESYGQVVRRRRRLDEGRSPWKETTRVRGRAQRRRQMLLVTRHPHARATRNRQGAERQWSAAFGSTLLDALRAAFPSFDVREFSDLDESVTGCVACQVRVFHAADVVVAMHGAGLAHTLFMRPNSAVVEVHTLALFMYSFYLVQLVMVLTRLIGTDRSLSQRWPLPAGWRYDCCETSIPYFHTYRVYMNTSRYCPQYRVYMTAATASSHLPSTCLPARSLLPPGDAARPQLPPPPRPA